MSDNAITPGSPISIQQVYLCIEELLELIAEPPSANCSCHLSPPCGDCVEHGHARGVIENARLILRGAGHRGPPDAQSKPLLVAGKHVYSVHEPREEPRQYDYCHYIGTVPLAPLARGRSQFTPGLLGRVNRVVHGVSAEVAGTEDGKRFAPEAVRVVPLSALVKVDSKWTGGAL